MQNRICGTDPGTSLCKRAGLLQRKRKGLILRASQVALVVENPPASARDVRDLSSIPGSGRSPGGGHGNPLQYSRLENPMDRGAWQATVHGVAELDMAEVSEHTHRS